MKLAGHTFPMSGSNERSTMKTTSKGQRGFTLVEILIVIAVLGVLAAIVTPAVSGVVTSARTQGKGGDIKNVEEGIARYQADNASALPITGSTSPTKSLLDTNTDAIIKVKVNTSATDPTGFPADSAVDVVCGSSSSTVAAALDQCFGSLDFAGKLVPTYVKSAPKHSTDLVTATADTDGATADLTITGGDSSKDTIQLYLDANIVAGDTLNVWNVDKDGKTIVLKNDDAYGKA